VLLGHSLGSGVSQAVLRDAPELVDGALLTGIAYWAIGASGTIGETAKQNRIARLQNPAKWSHLDTGYTTWVDLFSYIET
jgi:pimeloyl-ACP methyl ester carboxylesterase